MKTNIYILLIVLSIWNQSSGQQIINHVFDPSAFAIRGVAIPGMLGAATAMKNEQANSIIPTIIKEERDELNKWRGTVFGNVNTLNSLSIASRVLINRIDTKRLSILPIHYAPGFRKKLREFLDLKERTERLEHRVSALLGLGTLFIDGEGYYRVASQRLGIEYLEVYSELSEIDFSLTKLLALIGLLPLIAT